MRWILLAVPLLALVASAAWASFAPPADAAGSKAYSLDVVALACAATDDGVCLAYGGAIPGPLLDLSLGDRVTVTLTNRIAETVALLDVPDDVKAALSQASISFHAHGTSTPATMDGVPAHEGTQLVASVAAPGATFVYEFRAGIAGPWHYHDHVLGHDGSEGTLRGLFGAIVVRGGAESPPDATFDVHVLDEAANLGDGLDASVPAGSSFEILFAGLGNYPWILDVTAPDGSNVGSFDLGPGMTERARVASAAPGVYSWRATFGPFEHTGTVTAA